MTAINIITSLAALSLIWIFYMVMTAKEHPEWDESFNKEDNDISLIKVEDIPIGNTIYDLFPEWREEFHADPMMDEIAATCDLYLAAKELLKGGTANVKLIVSLDDAVHKFEKYAL